MDRAVEDVIELAQPRQRSVEHGHISAEADGHLGRMKSDDTAADDNNLAGANARHTAKKNPSPAMGLLQRRSAGLDRQAAGDF